MTSDPYKGQARESLNRLSASVRIWTLATPIGIVISVVFVVLIAFRLQSEFGRTAFYFMMTGLVMS